MRTTRLRHALAVVTAAAVLATMSAATVASPASAAKPKCQGKVATIVGTNKGERIVGTAKRDVIVAKGGNDRIYGKGGNDLICAGNGNDYVSGGGNADTIHGQAGNDTLNGNAGNDTVNGNAGNDTINGGINFDTCYQGTGAGVVVNCELPAPPPPPPPTLVVAYTDANMNGVYDVGDVMIAEIVDSDRNGVVSVNDTINMGQYPTRFDATTPAPARIRQTMEPWRVKSHTVTAVNVVGGPTGNNVVVASAAGTHDFWRTSGINTDLYSETGPGGTSTFYDQVAGADGLEPSTTSPSQALETLTITATSTADDYFLDVIFYITT